MMSNGSSYGTAESSNGGGSTGGEIMLFGVRVKVDPMRKSVSMNNLSQYVSTDDAMPHHVVTMVEDTGYASADDAVPHQATGGRERKRGVPWTEEEHKLFLLGLQKVGKGDWRGISRSFVKTRTPTQVASHAQKYFLRRNNFNRRRRRSSLFDITTDSVNAIPMEEGNNSQDKVTQQVLTMPETITTFPVAPFPNVMFPVQVHNPVESFSFKESGQVNNASTMFLRPVGHIPSSSTMVDLNLNPRFAMEQTQLSLGLSLSSGQSQLSSFQVMSSYNNGEGKSIISVG